MRSGRKGVRAGELTERLGIELLDQRVQNDLGEPVHRERLEGPPSAERVVTVWGRVTTRRGGEANRNSIQEAELTHDVEIRWRPDAGPGQQIGPTSRITWGDRVLEVVSLFDPDQRNERLMLECREIVTETGLS